jgi:hypothetical protein
MDATQEHETIVTERIGLVERITLDATPSSATRSRRRRTPSGFVVP